MLLHPESPPPRNRTRVATRDRIIAGIYDCFRRFGIRKTTIEDIATAAGVTRRTVYKYFPNKAEIVAEIAGLETVKTTREIAAALSASTRVEEMLTECLYQAVVVARQEPFRRELSGQISLAALSTDSASRIHAIQRDTWQPLLKPIFDAGRLARDLDFDTVVSWFSLNLYGLLMALEGAPLEEQALRQSIRRFPVEPLLPGHELPQRRTLPAPELARTRPAKAPDGTTQSAILQAASHCFSRHGFKLTAIADIAAHAGISSRTIYRYFADRETLVEQATAFEIGRLMAAIGERVAAVQPRDAALTEALLLLLRASGKNVFLRELLESGYSAVLPSAAPQLQPAAMARSWRELIDALEAQRLLRPQLSPEEIAGWLQYALHVLHAKVSLKSLSEERLRHFIRRLVIEPILAR